MEKDNEIRHGRHCVFKMHVHLVFVAKYRRKVFDLDAIDRLRLMFDKVCESFEASLVEMDGEDNHVHLLVEYPPKVAVSALVNSLKGVSSRLLRKERPDLRKRYWKNMLWSPSYFASSCGGAPIGIIKQYIEQQQTPA
jgi:putative transposase